MQIFSYLKIQVFSLTILTILVSFKATKMIFKGKVRKGQIWYIIMFKAIFLSTSILPIIYASPLIFRNYLLTFFFSYGIFFCIPIEYFGGVKYPILRYLWTWKALWKRGNIVCKWPKLSENSQYLFTVFPHGYFPLYSATSFIAKNMSDSFSRKFPRHSFRLMTGTLSFYIPFYRELALGLGGIDASRYSAHKATKKGHSLILYPGGASEAMYVGDNQYDIVKIKNRMGFVKLAIQEGLKIVPVFCFNESQAYEQFELTKSPVFYVFQSFLMATIGISFPFVKNIMPKPVNIKVVCGDPIDVIKKSQPSAAEIEEVHKIFISELRSLYIRNSNCNIGGERKIAIE